MKARKTGGDCARDKVDVAVGEQESNPYACASEKKIGATSKQDIDI